MLKRYFLLLLIAFAPIVTVAVPVSAVDVFHNDLCEKYSSGDPNRPTVCKDKDLPKEGGTIDNPLFGPRGILTSVINLLSIVVAIAAIIGIILGGLKYVTSGNNPQDSNTARERIIYAIVALIVAAIAQAIVQFVAGKYNS